MVRISTCIALVLSIALGAEASAICQCLFPDGSHCCVITVSNTLFLIPTERKKKKQHANLLLLPLLQKAQGAAEDCTELCRPAERTGDNVKCNADGKWSSVSGWNGQFRAGCNR